MGSANNSNPVEAIKEFQFLKIPDWLITMINKNLK